MRAMVTIPDSERRSSYAPVSATLNFPVGFPLFDDDDVVAFLDGVEVNDFTVSATYTDGVSTNAAVVANDPGWIGAVEIVGKRRPNRTAQFADGRGVPAKDINLVLNQIVAAQRETFNALERSLQTPFGDSIGPLPALANRKGMVLAFDAASGDPIASDLIGAQGDAGWSPVFSVVADGARRVLQVSDWTGGAGTKPATGKYVGASGFVTAIGDGIDIRGATGASGAGTGDMLAAQNLADLDDAPTARTNLGLGGLATQNLSDLGDLAAKDIAGYADIAAADLASEAQVAAGTASKLVPAASVPGAVATIGATVFEPLGAQTGVDTLTDNYTLILTDAGKTKEMNASTAKQFLIPANASVAFPLKSYVNFVRYGSGAVTIKGDTGVTVNGVSGGTVTIPTRYGSATIYKRATNEWIVPNATAA